MGNQNKFLDDEAMATIKIECLRLKNQGVSLVQIQKNLVREYNLTRTTNSISLWCKDAAKLVILEDNLYDLSQQQVNTIQELDFAITKIKRILTLGYLQTKVPDKNGVEQVVNKALSVGTLPLLLNSYTSLMNLKMEAKGLKNIESRMRIADQLKLNDAHNEQFLNTHADLTPEDREEVERLLRYAHELHEIDKSLMEDEPKQETSGRDEVLPEAK